MKLRRRCKNKNGFTLIEVLVVIGLLSVIAMMTIVTGISTVNRDTLAEERDLLVLLIAQARSRALANVNQSAHGVHIAGNVYTQFEGESLAGSDPAKHRTIPRASNVTISPIDVDIVFSQRSGNVTTGAGTITLAKESHTMTIEINNAGRIEW